MGARLDQSIGQLPAARLLAEPGRPAFTSLGPAHETIPAPEAAVRADQTLTLGEGKLEIRRLAGIDQGDLREPPGQRGRRRHHLGQRAAAGGQGRRVAHHSRANVRAPVNWRALIEAGNQIVAERGRKRLGMIRADLDQIDQRRAGCIRSGELSESFALRLDPHDGSALLLHRASGAFLRGGRQSGRRTARFERRSRLGEPLLGLHRLRLQGRKLELRTACRALPGEVGQFGHAPGQPAPPLLEVALPFEQASALLLGASDLFLLRPQGVLFVAELPLGVLKQVADRLAIALRGFEGSLRGLSCDAGRRQLGLGRARKARLGGNLRGRRQVLELALELSTRLIPSLPFVFGLRAAIEQLPDPGLGLGNSGEGLAQGGVRALLGGGGLGFRRRGLLELAPDLLARAQQPRALHRQSLAGRAGVLDARLGVLAIVGGLPLVFGQAGATSS